MTGFRTKSILCTPIKRNQETIGAFNFHNYIFCISPFYKHTVMYGRKFVHHIIMFFQGVCQLINKIDGRPFDENDESLFEV